MNLAIKTHWTDLKETLKAFPDPALGIEFHENEIDIDDKSRYEGQYGTITTLLARRKNASIAFHAPVLNTDPSSFDIKHQTESMQRIKRTIDLAKAIHDEIGAKKTIVNTHNMCLVSKERNLTSSSKKSALSTAKKATHELTSYARKNDITLTIENNPPILYKDEGKNIFGLFGRCAEDITHCKCSTCLDISHAYMSCFYFENRKKSINLPEMGKIDNVFLPDLEIDIEYYKKIPHSVTSLDNYIETLGNTISHVHLNDAVGYFHEGMVLGEGDINFSHILPLIKKDIMFVLEIKKAHLYQQRMKESLDYIQSHISR